VLIVDSWGSGAGFAFMIFSKISRADILQDGDKSMGVRGVKAAVTPDEPDVLDAGDVVEGPGVGGVASVSSVCLLVSETYCLRMSRGKARKMISFMPPLGKPLSRLPEIDNSFGRQDNPETKFY
jgi:hypothetical protein